MTGFGAAEGDIGPARVALELRTVNHRFFNPSIKLPGALARWEAEVREALRQRVSRGHVTLTGRIEKRERANATIDENAFADAVTRLRALRERHALGGELDVATVLRIP